MSCIPRPSYPTRVTMSWFFRRLTWSVLRICTDSAHSTPSLMDHLSDTISPIYPDRPIHPLPKRRLRSRVSSETAELILYTAASTPSKPLFSLPFNESVAFGTSSSLDPANDDPAAGDFQGLSLDQEKHGYQFRGSDPDSDYEEADELMRRYKAQQNGAFPPSNRYDLRGGASRPSKVIQPVSAPSPQESVDGYDSFENTNNKKKRKIPTSGSSGGHHSSLSADMASMGISTNGGLETSQTELDGGVGQYYGSGNFAVPASSSGTGISGAGRGRYGRGAARAPSGRSPLGVSINGSNTLQAGRQLLHKQDFTPAGRHSARGNNGSSNREDMND